MSPFLTFLPGGGCLVHSILVMARNPFRTASLNVSHDASIVWRPQTVEARGHD